MSDKREFNPIDTQAQAAAEKRRSDDLKLERDREIDDFKYLMEQPQGRRFIWRLLDKAGVFRSSFSLNGLEMSFKEGNRNLGIFLVSEAHEHCPDRYVQMMKEHKKAHEHRRGKR